MPTSVEVSPLIRYAVTLHQSTDYREKLYKVLQYIAKLLAARPSSDPQVAKVAATLSQSRGIFKVFKWVTCLEEYQKAAGESSVWLGRIKRFEAVLNTVVTMMQDAINVDKLCGTKLLSARFSYCMSALDLGLSLLLASIAGHAVRRLRERGVRTPEDRRKLLLLQLEVGVRVGDSITLLENVGKTPGGRVLWPRPSTTVALVASIVGASCATSAVMLKKHAALGISLFPTPPSQSSWAAAAAATSEKDSSAQRERRVEPRKLANGKVA
jgi:hypothetical protein